MLCSSGFELYSRWVPLFTFEGNKSIFIDPTFGIFVSGPLQSFVVNAGLYLKNRILHNFCPLLHH